jgi:hypothetical protein
MLTRLGKEHHPPRGWQAAWPFVESFHGAVQPPQFCEDGAVTTVVILVMAAAALGALILMNRNATLLFKATVQGGRIVQLRGRAPKRLVRDFNDVLGQRPVASATLRVCSEGERAVLRATGDLNDGEMQRLRNVLGTFPTAKIRSEPFRIQ